jgi:cation transport regulator
MPYDSIQDLPETMRDTMPREALEVYVEAYNEAFEEYEEAAGGEAGREAVAHRDGMHAVKREFVYDDDRHKWYRKGEEPEPEEEGGRGIIETLRDLIPEVDTENL